MTHHTTIGGYPAKVSYEGGLVFISNAEYKISVASESFIKAREMFIDEYILAANQTPNTENTMPKTERSPKVRSIDKKPSRIETPPPEELASILHTATFRAVEARDTKGWNVRLEGVHQLIARAYEAGKAAK